MVQGSSFLMVFVITLCFCTTVSGNPLYVYAGDEVTMDCPFERGSRPDLIQWTYRKGGYDNEIILKTYYNGEDKTKTISHDFYNRTEYLVNGTNRTNAHITIKQLKTNDSGTYICRVTNGRLSVVTVELSISERPTVQPECESVNEHFANVTTPHTVTILPVVVVGATLIAITSTGFCIQKYKKRQTNFSQKEHNKDARSEQKETSVSIVIKTEVPGASVDSAYSSQSNSNEDMNNKTEPLEYLLSS